MKATGAAAQGHKCVDCKVRDRISNGSKDDLNHLVTRKKQEPYWVNGAVTGEQLEGSCAAQSTGTKECINHLETRKPYWANPAVAGERPLEVGASRGSPCSSVCLQVVGGLRCLLDVLFASPSLGAVPTSCFPLQGARRSKSKEGLMREPGKSLEESEEIRRMQAEGAPCPNPCAVPTPCVPLQGVRPRL